MDRQGWALSKSHSLLIVFKDIHGLWPTSTRAFVASAAALAALAEAAACVLIPSIALSLPFLIVLVSYATHRVALARRRVNTLTQKSHSR
jgi:hypothetical protein